MNSVILAAFSVLNLAALAVLGPLIVTVLIVALRHGVPPDLALETIVWPKVIEPFIQYAYIEQAAFALLGGVSVLYWNLSGIFNRQWQYCCDLYLKVLQEKDHVRQAALRATLAEDLVVLDLWAHRSFAELFKDELERAIKEHCPGEESYYHSEIVNYRMDEGTAKRLIGRRLASLVLEIEKRDKEEEVRKAKGLLANGQSLSKEAADRKELDTSVALAEEEALRTENLPVPLRDSKN